jgi:hypothetical protein
MITPKEKARELVNKFAYQIREKEDKEGFIANVNTARECALIAVKEILKESNNAIMYVYWKQVKQELEAL